MKKIISDTFGKVLLDGDEIPGIFQYSEISKEQKVDRIDLGEAGTSKIPMGFSDGEVKLRLLLQNDEISTPYDKLKILNNLFKKTDEYGKPIIYQIVNAHTEARGINDVSFISLKSIDDNQKDWIICEVNFEEYRPILIESESIDFSQVPEDERIGYGDSSSGNEILYGPSPADDTDIPI